MSNIDEKEKLYSVTQILENKVPSRWNMFQFFGKNQVHPITACIVYRSYNVKGLLDCHELKTMTELSELLETKNNICFFVGTFHLSGDDIIYSARRFKMPWTEHAEGSGTFVMTRNPKHKNDIVRWLIGRTLGFHTDTQWVGKGIDIL